MGRRLLMIAYHFPPVRGSSGLHRTLTFSRYLAEDHGWEPTVLTVHPRAYEQTGDDLLDAVAPGVEVVRAPAWDTSRHLSIRGRYPLRLALPDNWATWWPGAVWKGRGILRRRKPAAIWSTFPIATAHRIGLSLARKSGLPWIADFRDSMTEDGYPTPRRKWEMWRRLEGRTVERCAKAVFTTPGARAMYTARYPAVPASRWSVIANGYDEELFADAERDAPAPPADGPLVLVHSGLLYRSERDPRPFFAALGALLRSGAIAPGTLRIRLRASGDEAYHREHIAKEGLGEVVSLEPGIAYRPALQEMASAHGLLLFQAANCNHQIPAKAYEYIRARRPVLALTDPAGDTAALLREAGAGPIVPLDDADAIAAALPPFLRSLRDGTAAVPSDAEVRRHSRRARAAELAAILDEVAR